MGARSHSRSGTKPLIGTAALLLVLLVLLMMFSGGAKEHLACAPLGPAQAASSGSAPIESPVTLDASVAPSSEPVGPAPHAAATAIGNVDGHVVDAATGESVPWIHVHLASGGVTDELITDASGAYTSHVDFKSGELTADLIDDDVNVASFTIEHSAAKGTHGWSLQAPIGPTFPVSLVDGSIPAPEAWFLRLVETTLPENCSGVLTVRPDSVAMQGSNADHPERAWPWIRLRPGEIAYARYPKQLHAPDNAYRTFVELKSASLFRRGREVVSKSFGVHVGLHFETEPYGLVTGNVKMDDVSAQWPILVYLGATDDERTRDRDSVVPCWEECVAEAGGAFNIETTLRGRLSLIAVCANAVSKPVGITLGASQFAGAAPRLRPAQTASKSRGKTGKVRGRDAIDSFGPDSICVRLRLATGGNWMRSWLIDAQNDVSIFDNLPEARFDTLAMGFGRTARFGPELPDRATPREWWQYADRGGSTYPHRILALEAGSERALDACQVTFGPSGGLFATAAFTTEDRFDVAEKAHVSWAVWQRDSAPDFGDESDFKDVRAPDREGLAIARMSPGWGVELSLRAGDPAARGQAIWPWTDDAFAAHGALLGAIAGPPLPCVEIRADDMRIAVTDANGDARISTRLMPLKLTLHAEGWKLAALERLPGGMRYVAWMKRAP
jgi:hypothetical protein